MLRSKVIIAFFYNEYFTWLDFISFPITFKKGRLFHLLLSSLPSHINHRFSFSLHTLAMSHYTISTFAVAAAVISSVVAVPSVTPSNDALALAKKVAGPGLTVIDASFQGGATMSGFYTNGPLGIPDSIVLTSGDATHPDDPSGEGTDVGAPGFDKCVTLSSSAGNAYDASVLTIKARVDDGYLGLFANFVFATDEYPKYVGSKYNDVFGIWVDGTQIACKCYINPSPCRHYNKLLHTVKNNT